LLIDSNSDLLLPPNPWDQNKVVRLGIYRAGAVDIKPLTIRPARSDILLMAWHCLRKFMFPAVGAAKWP
jgi:hypothetical protein